jgi:hypothetical protein
VTAGDNAGTVCWPAPAPTAETWEDVAEEMLSETCADAVAAGALCDALSSCQTEGSDCIVSATALADAVADTSGATIAAYICTTQGVAGDEACVVFDADCDAYDRSEDAANQACEDNGQDVEPSSSQDACEAAGASPSTVGGCVWDVKPPNCEVIIGDGTAANTCAPTDAFAPMIAGYIAQLNMMARVTACTPGDIGCSCDAAEAAAMEAQGNDNQDLSVVSDGCLSCVGMYLPLRVTVSSSSSH